MYSFKRLAVCFSIGFLLSLVGCAVANSKPMTVAQKPPPPQGMPIKVLFDKSVDLSKDAVVICVFIEDKNTLVCMPPDQPQVVEQL